jgi:hypothetical protein
MGNIANAVICLRYCFHTDRERKAYTIPEWKPDASYLACEQCYNDAKREHVTIVESNKE